MGFVSTAHNITHVLSRVRGTKEESQFMEERELFDVVERAMRTGRSGSSGTVVFRDIASQRDRALEKYSITSVACSLLVDSYIELKMFLGDDEGAYLERVVVCQGGGRWYCNPSSCMFLRDSNHELTGKPHIC